MSTVTVTVWFLTVLNLNTGTVERGGEPEATERTTCTHVAAMFNHDVKSKWPELRAVCVPKSYEVKL